MLSGNWTDVNVMTNTDDSGTLGVGFKPAPVPDNEADRTREVNMLGLTEVNRKDPNLNDIIRLACAIADSPIAMVNILDRPDQHTLRSCGLPQAAPTSEPIKNLICQFVLAHGDVLIIEDMRTDERTRNHPFVDPPTSMRFYAGAPLVSPSGYIVGTLCVMAPEPKTLDQRSVDSMRRLADLAIRLLLQGGPSNGSGNAVTQAIEKTPVRGQFHSQTSILFTDFAGFTRHTEALEPAVLLETLARYFGAFDKICKRFDLTRIKTIGDSYMAAAGIPMANADHARNAVAAGLAIRDYIAAENSARIALGEPAWEVRIGVHSGPAIAGSLGEHGIDVWGDTVNVASRLEGAGDVGRVNVSEATLTLLGSAITEERGTLPVKNKASLRMFFVDQLN
ncbi:adenylate/guanylate cyclase domain-containing protein [Labrenzia sp. PHM005]|uniref:adenylate/guanylate cyclase domain-containing protein n=1 Tax=Labrenzia sp. PHM005 TaxID=2590016 RepID=UPI001FFCC38A|nr:adenylate/guanylate cyclase domain-containing protein [Labrenzia sp. PHM005]